MFEVGDKVRCIDTKNYAWINKNEIYTVKYVREGEVFIIIDESTHKSYCYENDLFEKIEEDKMKKISKWEDLNGLELEKKGIKSVILGDMLIVKSSDLGTVKKFKIDKEMSLKTMVEFLKQLDFNITYHKKTVSEVIKEFEKRDRPFIPNGDNYCVYYSCKDYFWKFTDYSSMNIFGCKWYDVETAQEFVIALNEAEED